MEILEDILNQITKAPPIVITIFVATLFGVVWKRLPFTNRWLPLFTVGIPTVLYPVLVWDDLEMAKKFFHPNLVSVVYGFAAGCLAEVGHDGIVAKLKKMGVNFPENTGQPSQDGKSIPPEPPNAG